MPIKPIDCSKYVIYKIVCLDLEVDYLYVGSTTNFTRRKQQHKNDCNNPKKHNYDTKIYKIIRANGGWENWKMIKIKDFPCDSKWEAIGEEDRIMLELNANLNSHRASRSQKEYRSDNKEQIAKNLKHYYVDNKEKLLENQKQYYTNNKETISEYKKQYYSNNKEQIAEYKKQYYTNNKEKFAEKINCECGCVILKYGEKRHKKSPKHLQLMKQLELQN